MAQISVTEILATDIIAASRVTINENFNIVRDAINEIENNLNTTTRSLSIRNITIERGSSNVNDILFENQASSEIDGNLFVAGNLNITDGGSNTILFEVNTVIDGGDLTINNPVNQFINEGKNIIRGITRIENYQTINVAQLNNAGLISPEITTTDKRIIYLDFSTFDSGDSNNDNAQIILLAGEEGQIIDLIVSDFPAGGVPTPVNSGHIESNNLASSITQGITFSDALDSVRLQFVSTAWIPISYTNGVSIV